MPHIGETLPKAQVTYLTKAEFEHEIESQDLCFILVSTSHLLVRKRLLFQQMFRVYGLSFLMFFQLNFPLDSLHCGIFNIKLIFTLMLVFPNTKNYVVKWKTWYLKATYERVRVHVLTLFFLCPRKRGLGKCTLIGEPSIKLPFGIAFLSRD